MPDSEEIEQDICGESYDHDERVTYDGPDGWQWVCLRCGAEGWEDAGFEDEDSAASLAARRPPMAEHSEAIGQAGRSWSNADQNRLMACKEHILQALKDAMGSGRRREDWVEFERLAVAVAANEWAQAHGYERRVTVEDVERIEVLAVGHVDYARKLALYVAEFVAGLSDSFEQGSSDD